ncbi:uncharacterized protein LOC128492255 [Spea bombifrons]|uniref:uncharacterized protein LOC128492255 n=1 Tax=Spea bombifrons TaxID=233779 RepID=UPI002348F41A|nr:uncharacterized protein LOC128492255 [Spea bombifrons]
MRLHQTEAAEGPTLSIWPTVSMNKMKNEEQKTEMILNYALEIIYMLTGEKYTIGKKCSRHRKNNIRLVTEEVPIKCDDVAIFFTKDEWEYLQQHKEFYQDVIKANKQGFNSFPAHNTSGTIPAQIGRNIDIPKVTLLTPRRRHRFVKRTRLHLPKSPRFTQLVRNITNLGRRVAKIDRNISHILKQFKRKSATYDEQYPEGWVCEKLGIPKHFKEDEVMLGDCQDPEYQPCQTTLPISSFGPFSYTHDVIEPQCKMYVQTQPVDDSTPLNSPNLTVNSEVSELSQTFSPCTADSTGEALPDTPPSAVSTVLHTSSKTSLSTVAIDAQPDKTSSNLSRILEKKQAQLNNTNAKDYPGEAASHPDGPAALRTTARLPVTSSSSSSDVSTVKCPAFIIVSKVAEDQQPQFESLRTPDSVGEPLPDILLASMSAGLLNNFKMQSRGQPHRYAQLLFQHHVPYSLYKTWTHNTNYDGSRGKHALPKNLKRLIINETSMAFKMTPPVLKKIKDTLNGLLRIPRTGGWDSNSNFV